MEQRGVSMAYYGSKLTQAARWRFTDKENSLNLEKAKLICSVLNYPQPASNLCFVVMILTLALWIIYGKFKFAVRVPSRCSLAHPRSSVVVIRSTRHRTLCAALPLSRRQGCKCIPCLRCGGLARVALSVVPDQTSELLQEVLFTDRCLFVSAVPIRDTPTCSPRYKVPLNPPLSHLG